MGEASERQIIGEAVQRALHEGSSDDIAGNVVTGWVLIAESMGPDGERWLSRVSGGAAGGAPPTWTAQGWLFNALHERGWTDDE